MEENSNSITIKIETRAATKMCVAIFPQERLELTVEYFSNWNFVEEEIDIGHNPHGTIQTTNNNHDNLNNSEVGEIGDATSS